MIRQDGFYRVAIRGHRYAGAIAVRGRERHFVALTVAGIAVAVLGAAYGAYSASEASAQQAAYARKNAKVAEEAEAAAGTARENQIAYDADKKSKSFLSRAAAAGVRIDSPSLLESETAFASETSYAKQLAKYPHQLAGWSENYKGALFGHQEKAAGRAKYMNAGIAGGSTLATGALKAYGGGGAAQLTDPV